MTMQMRDAVVIAAGVVLSAGLARFLGLAELDTLSEPIPAARG